MAKAIKSTGKSSKAPQTMEELLGEINNLCYMGLDCVNAMIFRKLSGLESIDSYVEKWEKS